MEKVEEENFDIEFEPIIYSVYARADEKGKVIKIFSDCFELPQDGDFFIKSGSGDEFAHTGYYQIYTEDMIHKYCIDNGTFRECTKEEIEKERAEKQINLISVPSDKMRIAELEQQVADLTEYQADLLYEICLTKLGMEE